MGLIKNEHGVFHVRRKVPKALEVATARVMGVPKQSNAEGFVSGKVGVSFIGVLWVHRLLTKRR
jgi:hypothetical protein